MGDAEEPIAPPNSPVYEDTGFLEKSAPEAVAVQQPCVNNNDGYATMDLDDSQDFQSSRRIPRKQRRWLCFDGP